jgi:hypothetical protein
MGKWYSVLKDTTVNFCRGYILGKHDAPPPRLSFRLVRSDGKVMDVTPADLDVSVGMVAGFPTAEQYEAAAARAIEKAQVIRARNERDERRRQERK